MSLQKYVLFVLQLTLLINARNSMNGVYVNGNIALAIVCYHNLYNEGRMFTISGTIFDISNSSVNPIYIFGWSDSCLPTPRQEWQFTLNLRNRTHDFGDAWYIYWRTTSLMYIKSDTINLQTGHSTTTNLGYYRCMNEHVDWLY